GLRARLVALPLYRRPTFPGRRLPMKPLTTRSWIRRLFARSPRRAAEGSRKAKPRFRPAVEALEQRLAPATITVNNPSDTDIVGQITLRKAINNAGTGDVINIAVSGTDVLGSNMTPLTATNTTINVTAGNMFTVNGAGMFRDFSVAAGVQVVVN